MFSNGVRKMYIVFVTFLLIRFTHDHARWIMGDTMCSGQGLTGSFCLPKKKRRAYLAAVLFATKFMKTHNQSANLSV